MRSRAERGAFPSCTPHLAPPLTPRPQVDTTLSCFTELQAQHAAAGVQARSLASACERLLSEKGAATSPAVLRTSSTKSSASLK